MANVYNKPIIVVGGGGAELTVDNGMIYENKYRVRYFDIDGTILKIEYVDAGGGLTPPNNPNFDNEYLIFDEWNYDINNYVVYRPVDVGAIYKTINNSTYIKCRFIGVTGLSVELSISGFTSIDWGDGTVDTNTTHTYAKEGNYVINITGSITFLSSSSIELLGSTSANRAVKRIYCSQITNIPTYAFAYLYNLEIISLPKLLKTIGTNLFYNNTVLSACNLPKMITSIPSNIFMYCDRLKSFTYPENIETMGESVLRNSGLLEVSLPASIVKVDDFQPRVCEVIVNSDFITGNAPIIKTQVIVIWVKDEYYNSVINSSGLQAIKDYIKPLSWYPSLTDPNA